MDSGRGDVELADVFASVTTLAIRSMSKCSFWNTVKKKTNFKVCPSKGGTTQLRGECKMLDGPKMCRIFVASSSNIRRIFVEHVEY